MAEAARLADMGKMLSALLGVSGATGYPTVPPGPDRPDGICKNADFKGFARLLARAQDDQSGFRELSDAQATTAAFEHIVQCGQPTVKSWLLEAAGGGG